MELTDKRIQDREKTAIDKQEIHGIADRQIDR